MSAATSGREEREGEGRLDSHRGERTSTARVVVASIVCLLLGIWFANLLRSFGVERVFCRVGFPVTVWVASRIGRERVLTATLPTAGFLVWWAALSFVSDDPVADQVREAGVAVVTLIASLLFAWWLVGRHMQTQKGAG